MILMSSVWSVAREIGDLFSLYMMSPLSGCSSGFAYPFVKVIVLPPESVTALSASASGVPAADELAPVTAFAPENATNAPVVEFVP